MPRVSFGSFSLEVPSDWSFSSVILAGPPGEEVPRDPRMPAQASRPFQSNLVATLEQVKEDTNPEDYVEKQIAGLIQAGVPREEAAPPERVKFDNGASGLLTEQVITGPGGEQVRQLQLVVIKGGIAHTVIASQLAGEPFERMRDQFREILLSFGEPLQRM